MQEPNINPKLKKMAMFYLGEALGNAEKSAVMAGYSPRYARGKAYKIVKREDFQEYLKYLNSLAKEETEKEIATIADIQNFWTQVMNNGEIRVTDRIKASELLAKVQGAFKDDW